MIRADVPGANEAWTPASRGALLRTALAVAARPVGARWARTGTLTSAIHLDRPSVPYTHRALTALVKPAINAYAVDTTDTQLTSNLLVLQAGCFVGVSPYVFALYAPGTLRAIRCRDYLYPTTTRNPAIPKTIVHIEVLRRNATNTATQETILNGTNAASIIPFDISDLDVDVGGYGVDTFTVRARDHNGTTLDQLLGVEFEFSVDLV